jgi:hypothetical protein
MAMAGNVLWSDSRWAALSGDGPNHFRGLTKNGPTEGAEASSGPMA